MPRVARKTLQMTGLTDEHIFGLVYADYLNAWPDVEAMKQAWQDSAVRRRCEAFLAQRIAKGYRSRLTPWISEQ